MRSTSQKKMEYRNIARCRRSSFHIDARKKVMNRAATSSARLSVLVISQTRAVSVCCLWRLPGRKRTLHWHHTSFLAAFPACLSFFFSVRRKEEKCRGKSQPGKDGGRWVKAGGNGGREGDTKGENEDVWFQPETDKTKGTMLGMRKWFAYERRAIVDKRLPDLLQGEWYLIRHRSIDYSGDFWSGTECGVLQLYSNFKIIFLFYK